MKTKAELDNIAKNIRADVVKMACNSKATGAHIGGSFSVAEILAVLYGSVMNVSPSDCENKYRDRLILSKSHAAIALYSALSQVGFITRDEIDNAMVGKSFFYKHPQKALEYGIECSGGSLGMGLSFEMGMGYALRLDENSSSRVFVIVGDGECNEGSIWEAAASIIHYNLNNVIVVVDNNRLQIDGTNDEVLRMGSMKERWSSMGFDVIEVDGHDVEELQDELSIYRNKPTVILANTIKGKGVSFTENACEWHVGRLTNEQRDIALQEIMGHDRD